MINMHKRAAVQLVNQHGKCSIYKQVTEGEFNVETLTTENTEKQYKVKLFKNHFKASQFHFPNLVGKDAAEFYIANNELKFKPAEQDFIEYDSTKYLVVSINENWANGELCLYRLVAVRN
jgi:hypothetical protein